MYINIFRFYNTCIVHTNFCQLIIKSKQEFYRADPSNLLKERKQEIKKGVYDPEKPYRHIKTGGFFEACSGPGDARNEPQSKPKPKATSIASILKNKS